MDKSSDDSVIEKYTKRDDFTTNFELQSLSDDCEL